jgi:hypothetical protein
MIYRVWRAQDARREARQKINDNGSAFMVPPKRRSLLTGSFPARQPTNRLTSNCVLSAGPTFAAQ